MRTFFLGGLADRMGRRIALVTTFVGMALALLVWAFSRDFWPLVAFALAYGVFYGGWVAVLPAVVMDFFGGRNVSGIIGILYTSVAFGTLIGPSAAGFAFDLTGLHATDPRQCLREHDRCRYRGGHVEGALNSDLQFSIGCTPPYQRPAV